METAESRTSLLIGEMGLQRLKQSCVLVLGVGGVGSYCAEALARSGIGKLILVDGDTVAPSNLNRQIMAQFDTVGQPKTAVMKARIHTYRSDIQITCHQRFYDKEANAQIFSEPVDFVVDAIDTLSAKRDCIATKIEIMDLMKTSYDPLAKVMRQMIRKADIRGKIPVVCSTEQPIIQHQIINAEGKTRKEKMPPASSSFVPAAAGLACASYAVRQLLK